MIGYITLGTNDLARAEKFYNDLFSVWDVKALNLPNPKIRSWHMDSGGAFSVCLPHDDKPASVGNGTMVALNAGNKEMVGKLYHKAIELGGADEGAPGWRGEGEAFYGAYFRDLDGNKICAFFFGGAM
jgi:predicted lactoylglutathione lyase